MSIPDYELIRLIGRGAYGEVWLARTLTGIYRAVKIIARSKFSDVGPFEREFRGLKEFAAISIQESSQLAVLHVGRNEAEGFFYYVMELADDARGGSEFDPGAYRADTLARRRAEGLRSTPAESVAIGIALAQALAALHARGLVHRDIKPANIVFVGGKPKLADIGLVAAASEAMTYVGTDGYIPPDGAGTPAADLFSLGRVLYEVATGLSPNEFPRLPSGWETNSESALFAQLNRVILRAADSVRDRRYPSAEAMLADLNAVAAGKKVGKPLRLNRSATLLAGGTALILLLTAGAIIGIRSLGGSAPRPDSAAALIERGRLLSSKLNFHRNDLVAAQNLARSATDLEPNSAEAWGLRAWVEAAFIYRHWDEGAERKQVAEGFANHALSLDPEQPAALEALGQVLMANNASAAGEPLLRRALRAAPDDPLSYRLLANDLAIQGRPKEAYPILQAAARRFPDDMVLRYNLAVAEIYFYQRRYGKSYADLALADFHHINRVQPMAYSLLGEAHFQLDSIGDLNDLRSALDALESFPLEDRSDDRAIYFAALGRIALGQPERVPEITALTSRRYLDDTLAYQPVAWLDAMAEVQQGHLSAALVHWQDAEAVLRQKLRDVADDAVKVRHVSIQLATTLVWLNRREEAASLIAPTEAMSRDGMSFDTAGDLARYYLALGDVPRAMKCAPLMQLHPFNLKLDPWWAPARKSPDYAKYLDQAKDFP